MRMNGCLQFSMYLKWRGLVLIRAVKAQLRGLIYSPRRTRRARRFMRFALFEASPLFAKSDNNGRTDDADLGGLKRIFIPPIASSCEM
jgi:hypothetical protein